MSRFRAFGIHLGISLAIFVVVLGLLVLAWYPWPLFDLEGGWQGIRLVALVDIVLGPLLTLILFRSGKPGLKFDMSVVVLMQVGALIYGMLNLYDARPVLLVHADDHFRPLSRTLLAEWDDSGRLLAKWERATPQFLRVDLPDDPVAFADLDRENRHRPGQLHGLFERYQPLREDWQRTLRDAVLIEPYVGTNPNWQARYATFLSSLDRAVDELAFFPYIGRHERLFLAFDRRTQEIVGVLDVPFDPWLTRREVPRFQRAELRAPAETGDTPRQPTEPVVLSTAPPERTG